MRPITSAATAQAGWFAAQIQIKYPNYWPETIRALMIHSAEWTDTLEQQFLKIKTKKSYINLLRACGYGVPNLNKALYSASNSLTLIKQAELQPFNKKESRIVTKDMHLYELPWPKEVLQNLPLDTKVEMRITLSYFIEPGPGDIGWKDRYRYRYSSHGLRFDINNPNESKDNFLKRINKAARDEEEGHPGTGSSSSFWVLGSKTRNRGAIHSDIWSEGGTAAQLATSNLIAIYPVTRWWKERSYLEKWNKIARYSLIVSIYTPEQSVDIYTPVKVQIDIKNPIEIKT
jgi:Subtilase family